MKNFVPHHREIGAIWCNFKRFNTILNSEILLNFLHKMIYVTDKFKLCFCFALAKLNSYILFLHSQHNRHVCRQLGTYALSCLPILVHDDIDIDALVTELKPLKNISCKRPAEQRLHSERIPGRSITSSIMKSLSESSFGLMGWDEVK